MSSTKSPIKVAIVAPTCFYYQAALFRELAADPRIDLTVYFAPTRVFLREMSWKCTRWIRTGAKVGRCSKVTDPNY